MFTSKFTSWEASMDLAQELIPPVTINLNKNDSNNILHNVMAVYALAQDALEKLQNHELKAFDALATECSCHLRALCLQDIFTALKEDHDLQISLSDAIASLTQKIKTLQHLALALTTKEISQPTKAQEKQHAKKCGCFTKALLIKELWQKHQLPGLPPYQQVLCPEESQKMWLKALKKQPQYDLHKFLAKVGHANTMPTAFVYAISAYLLTLVKTYEPAYGNKFKCSCTACSAYLTSENKVFREETNEDMLAIQSLALLYNKYGIGSAPIHKTFINNKVYKATKKVLTTLSQEVLIAQASQFNVSSLLPNTCEKIGNQLQLADYYSLTSTFAVALHKQIPVILKVQNCLHAHQNQEIENTPDVALYLKPGHDNFSPAPLPVPELWGHPAIVVEGKRSHTQTNESTEEYVKRLMLDFDFLKQCEMDGAQHRQYTNNELGQKPSQTIPLLQEVGYEAEAQKLDALKEQAEQSGCSFNNQSKLILAHIFADTLQNQIASLPGLFEQTLQTLNNISEANHDDDQTK